MTQWTRTVTATYRYGQKFITVIESTKDDCDRRVYARWGQWDGEPCYSSPRTILSDLTGATRRRHAGRGFRKSMGSG